LVTLTGEQAGLFDHKFGTAFAVAVYVMFLGAMVLWTARCLNAADQGRQQSERLFTTFMHNLPAPAWIKDLQGRYVYCNKAFQDSFHAHSDAWQGKTDQEVLLAETIGKLVSDHLRLSRLELTDDAMAMGSRIGVIAGFSLVVVVGYALLCGAIATFAGAWITPAGGWLLMGGLNLIVGGVGLTVALARLKLPEHGGEMIDEVETQARASVMSIARGTRP
jgi:hypothetical protein